MVNSGSNNVTVIDGGPPRTTPPAWVRRNIMAAAAKADFNADGKADLVWRHTSGAVSLWKMNGVTPAEVVSLTPTAAPDWKPVGSGDLDGDGKPEIVWQNTDGRLAAWFMSGDTLQRSSYLNPVSPGSPAWKVVALADMNQDGKADLIWQHDNGSLAVWYMDGVTLIGWTFLTPASVEDTQWRIVGAGDVDGDGKPDLVWQHSEGWVGAWIMSGAQATAWLPLTPGQVDPSWKIRAVIDLNGDGQTDLVWQHRDGWVCAWLMIGAKVASMPFLASSRSTPAGNSWDLDRGESNDVVARTRMLSRRGLPDERARSEDGILARVGAHCGNPMRRRRSRKRGSELNCGSFRMPFRSSVASESMPHPGGRVLRRMYASSRSLYPRCRSPSRRYICAR